MNSIFIFILFVVGSIIFEAIKQSGSAQKQKTSTKRPVAGPAVKPVVAPHRNPGSQNSKVQPDQGDKSRIAEAAERNMDQEGVQTEGPKGMEPLKQTKTEIEPASEQGSLDIGIDELQRSIIMAEVLGKPKALRKN